MIMEEQTFEEQINTPFSLDGIPQDDDKHEAIISDLEPKGSTMDDVLFSAAPMRSITEPVEVMEETTILQGTPVATTIPNTAPAEKPAGINEGSLAALLSQNESEHFRSRWNEIQGMFVDEPRTAVQQADELVSDVIEMITRIFSDEHNTLEVQWNQGNDVSTEDLRQALQHYRTFFNRLVV
jgi:hypothetical protein